MKRQVRVVLGPWTDGPLSARDCVYKTFDVDTVSESQLKVLAVSVSNQSSPLEPTATPRAYDSSGTVIDGSEIDSLVGKLLTYVDATYNDSEQRTAHKNLIRQTVWSWFTNHRVNGEKTIEFAATKE